MDRADYQGQCLLDQALSHIKQGKMIVLTDDADRENEGDLIVAAEFATPEVINFMAKHARGLICLAMEEKLLAKLQLPMMVDHSKQGAFLETAFTASIDAREGITTGISAADRAHSIAVAIADDVDPNDVVVPGHIFPLKAKQGGVLQRTGHTEGGVDLARLCGLKAAAVICEIMNDDGSMARGKDLFAFAKKFEMPILSIAELVSHRLLNDSGVRLLKSSPFQTPKGTFNGHLFESNFDGSTHFALTNFSSVNVETEVAVRVHKQQALLDSLGVEKLTQQSIDTGFQLLTKKEPAAFIYLANDKWELGPSSHKMDPHMLGIGAQIIRHLGILNMRLYLRSPRPLGSLGAFGLNVKEQVIMGEE